MPKNKQPNISELSETELIALRDKYNTALGDTLLDIKSSAELYRAGAIGSRAFEDNDQYNSLRREAILKKLDEINAQLGRIALS